MVENFADIYAEGSHILPKHRVGFSSDEVLYVHFFGECGSWDTECKCQK